MKTFEFITSMYSAEVLDKYVAEHITAEVSNKYKVLFYPEINFDSPVRPLCNIDISSRIRSAIYDTINSDHEGIIVVSYSSDVYKDFHHYLKNQEVVEMTMFVVDEDCSAKSYTFDLKHERFCRLNRQISLIYQRY